MLCRSFSFLRPARLISCPICEIQSTIIKHSPAAPLRFKSLLEFQAHLRTHQLALNLPPASQPPPQTRRQRSRASAHALARTLTTPSRANSRSFRTALTALRRPWALPPRRWHPTTMCSSDAMFYISQWVIHQDHHQHQHQQQQQKDVLLVDYANVPGVFETLDQIDPGAEIFLHHSRSKIVVVHEPRAKLDLLSNRWSANVIAERRLATIFCRRGREMGDVTMADLISRIVNSPPHSSSGCCDLRFHIVSNDLRHRRAIRDCFHKPRHESEDLDLGVPSVEVVGHHAFGQTACEWRRTLSDLLTAL